MAKIKIVGARKNIGGNLNEFLLNDGNWISLKKAIILANNGEIDAVVVKSNNSNSYLRSKPDSTKTNNFESLAESYKPYLTFNGDELCWLENSQKIDCW